MSETTDGRMRFEAATVLAERCLYAFHGQPEPAQQLDRFVERWLQREVQGVENDRPWTRDILPVEEQAVVVFVGAAARLIPRLVPPLEPTSEGQPYRRTDGGGAWLDSKGRVWYGQPADLPADPLSCETIPPDNWHPDASRKYLAELHTKAKRALDDSRFDGQRSW